MMQTYLPIAGLITAAVITPGPNNIVVLRAAARRGFFSAVQLNVGVIGGSLLLLVLVWSGAGFILADIPAMQQALAVLGALYLVWLGVGLLRSEGRRADSPELLPDTPGAIAIFQLLNPKAWVLVTTAVAAAPATVDGLVGLSLLFCLLPFACLSLWACAGSMMSAYVERPLIIRRFERAMGVLLVASAVALILAQDRWLP